MSNPVKQHYVPQVYLNYFTNPDGYLQIYDITNGQFRKQAPANVAYQKHFYTIEVDGQKDYSIENLLANHIDNLYKPIINKIENKIQLSKEDKDNLATFVTFQYLRTPSYRDTYYSVVDDFYKQTAKIIFDMKKAHGLLSDFSDKDIEQLGDIINNEKFELKIPKENSLDFMLKSSEQTATFIMNQNFMILEASSKSEFITTDNPYCMIKDEWVPEWSGFGVVNTKKVFPLTPKYLLVLLGDGGKIGYYKLNKMDVRNFNLLIAHWADRLLFSTNETLLKSIVDKKKAK